MPRILLKIRYNGSRYYGWQKQEGLPTVQGLIEEALSEIAKYPVQIFGTSRTDAKVHARMQCASLDWEHPLPVEKLPEVCNNYLRAIIRNRYKSPQDIEIYEAVIKPNDFNARFDCKYKTYEYLIELGNNLFTRDFTYQVAQALDIESMRRAASQLIGTHDFKSMEASGSTPRETTIRTIYDLTINEDILLKEPILRLRITGDGFLYNMVRIIVGTLVEVGQGKISTDQIKPILDSLDRSCAGHTAPPQGLYLDYISFEKFANL